MIESRFSSDLQQRLFSVTSSSVLMPGEGFWFSAENGGDDKLYGGFFSYEL